MVFCALQMIASSYIIEIDLYFPLSLNLLSKFAVVYFALRSLRETDNGF